MFVGRYALKLLRKAIARPLYRKFAVFEAACQRPQQTQEELLRTILAYHAGTAFGVDHGFADIRTVADFRRQVPVAPYEHFEPYIRRVMKGETNALLADPQVLMFALTSGTTSARKHIPITQQYLDDYRRSWNLWGLRAIKKHKHVFLKPILQLAGDADEYRTEAGIPCGNLSGFTAQVQKRIMRWMYVVPPATGKMKDAHARTYVALRMGLRKPLGMLMSANPSTLVNLARFMDREKESLIRDLHDGTLNANLDIPADIRADIDEEAEAEDANVPCSLSVSRAPRAISSRKTPGPRISCSSAAGPAAASARISASFRGIMATRRSAISACSPAKGG